MGYRPKFYVLCAKSNNDVNISCSIGECSCEGEEIRVSNNWFLVVDSRSRLFCSSLICWISPKTRANSVEEKLWPSEIGDEATDDVKVCPHLGKDPSSYRCLHSKSVGVTIHICGCDILILFFKKKEIKSFANLFGRYGRLCTMLYRK